MNKLRTYKFLHIAAASSFVICTVSVASLITHEKLWKSTGLEKSAMTRMRDSLKWPKAQNEHLTPLPTVFENIKQLVRINWNQTGESQRICAILIGINTAVFLGWQIPGLRIFMNRHFVHIPARARPYTLLTSVFSHQDLLHYSFNMYALYNFYTAFAIVGQQTPGETLSFYLSAGVLASLASHLFSSFIPGRAISGGLGASGAIYGLVAG